MTMNRVTDQDQIERQANLKKSHVHCIKKERLRTGGNKREKSVHHNKKRKWINERHEQCGEIQCFRSWRCRYNNFK